MAEPPTFTTTAAIDARPSRAGRRSVVATAGSVTSGPFA